MASLGKELKLLRIELREHNLNAVERNQKPIDPNQTGRQNATKFCGYCRTNGPTPSYCWKQIRYEVKKLQNEATAGKKVTFIQDYKKRRGPSHGCGNWTSPNDDDHSRRSLAHAKQWMMELWFQPRNLTTQKNFDRAIRIITTLVEIDVLSEGTTRITTAADTMTTELDHHIRQTEVNRGIGAVTKTINDRLQLQNKTSPSWISAKNSDRINLILQCLPVLDTKIRPKIYLTRRSSRPPITVISQT